MSGKFGTCRRTHTRRDSLLASVCAPLVGKVSGGGHADAAALALTALVDATRRPSEGVRSHAYMYILVCVCMQNSVFAHAMCAGVVSDGCV
jgi:hypothetical protein